MRNRLLRTIFPERVTSNSSEPISLPSFENAPEAAPRPQVNPELAADSSIATAFPGLVPPSTVSLPGLSAIATGAIPGTGTTDRSETADLFGDISKNLDRLRAASEAQTTVIGANTSALANNTAAKSTAQTISSVAKTASGFLGGLTALPLISGLFSLFGGGTGNSDQQQLTKYSAPTALTFDESTQSTTERPGLQDVSYDQFGNARSPLPNLPSYDPILANTPISGSTAQSIESPNTNAVPVRSSLGQGSPTTTIPNTSTNVTVHVQAMDSQSFLDRSKDIAQAVREAMLNMHPINDVINDL